MPHCPEHRHLSQMQVQAIGSEKHLKRAKACYPTMILITDGLLDCPKRTTHEAINDAMAGARDIKKAGYDFIAIGLKPHNNQLAQLSEAAGGTVYIVNELKNNR